MSLEWSLKELYDSFEGENFQEDLKKLDVQLQKMIEWAEQALDNHEDEKEKLEKIIEEQLKLFAIREKLGAFCHLVSATDSKNKLALKYSDILRTKMNTLAETITKTSKWISSIENLQELIESSPLLKEHEFYLNEIVEDNAHMLDEREESIIARMKNTGSSAWANYKNLLVSMHKVEIEDKGEIKEYPLTVVLNMAYDTDKEVREKAYHAEIASYKKIEEGVAAALNGIKGEALTLSELRGYSSPLEMTLQNSRMDRETLDAMLAAMKESMPKFRSYLRRKAELLGYKNGLPFYELYAPVSSADMTYSYEQGQAFVEENFRSFSEHLGNFARKAFDHNWIDVMPKEGKRSGAHSAQVSVHSKSQESFLTMEIASVM